MHRGCLAVVSDILLQQQTMASVDGSCAFDVVQTSNLDGSYALHVACSLSDPDCAVSAVDWVLQQGVVAGAAEMVLANTLDNTLNGPLAIACRMGHVEAVERLLNARADASNRDQLGNTALHYAQQLESEEQTNIITDILCLRLASIQRNDLLHIKNSSGKSPQDMYNELRK